VAICFATFYFFFKFWNLFGKNREFVTENVFEIFFTNWLKSDRKNLLFAASTLIKLFSEMLKFPIFFFFSKNVQIFVKENY
jgi:hypothetical protein